MGAQRHAAQGFLVRFFSLAILLVVVSCAVEIIDDLPTLELHQFTLAQLQSPSSESLSKIQDAIFNVGILAVNDEQSADIPFGGSLQAFTRCIQDGYLKGETNEVELADHTLRSTFATATNHSTPLPLAGTISKSCPDFAKAAGELRQTVDETGRVYARLLDRLVHKVSAKGVVDTSKADSFVAAVMKAESLEHFHLYRRSTPAPLDQAALEMHSDMGLFIVMTSAEYYSLATGERLEPGEGKPESGFRLELPSGEIVKPIIPDRSLLIMNGEGASLWLRGAASVTWPHAPAHEVVMPDLTGVGRAWFGRMYMPPRDAILQGSNGVTFNEHRQQTYTSFRLGQPHLASTAGCSPVRRSLADEGSCGAGEVYCWMTCMAVTPGCMGTNVCMDTSGSLHTTGMCVTCSVRCASGMNMSMPPPSLGGTTEFCNTGMTATTMWMTGFQTSKDGSMGCVAYLFSTWVLDSRVKFAFACVGTFLMGVTVSALGFFRTKWHAQDAGKSGVSRAMKEVCLVALYLVQMTLAYSLMLIAMTYQVELFIMIITGLACGYWLFGLVPWSLPEAGQHHPVHVDPCCVVGNEKC